MEYRIVTKDELQHHGVKGMKWGQHIFGKKARTDRKRKRTLKKARVEKAKQKKISEQRRKDFEAGKIKPKDMTIEELYEYKAKLALQKDIYDLRSQNSAKTVTAGKKAISDTLSKGLKAGIDEGIKNGTSELVKKLLVRAGNRAFGFDEGGNGGKQQNQSGKQQTQSGQQNPGKKSGNNNPVLDKIKTKSEKKFNTKGLGSFTKTTAQEFKKSGASYGDIIDAFKEPAQAVKRAADPAVNAVRNSDTAQLGRSYLDDILLLPAPKDED